MRESLTLVAFHGPRGRPELIVACVLSLQRASSLHRSHLHKGIADVGEFVVAQLDENIYKLSIEVGVEGRVEVSKIEV
jgi:hypothetical protein